MAKNRLARFSNFNHEEFIERKLEEKRKTLAKRKKFNENRQRKASWLDERPIPEDDHA